MGGKAKRVIENPIAYIIEDKVYGKFEIKNSPNAWWLERGKVELLLGACKIDASVEECCSYAGITLDKYKYFYEKHPEFSNIKHQLNQLPFLKARNKIVSGLDETFQNAMDYMKRKKKQEFSERQEMTGADGQPINIIFDNSFNDSTFKTKGNNNKPGKI